MRVHRQVERERGLVQLAIAHVRVVRHPGVGQVRRGDCEVHVGHAGDGLVREAAQGPRRREGEGLHRDVLRQRDGEEMVPARQIEPVARIHVAELDEPGEALGQHRVDRDAAGREVVPLRVDDVGAAKEALVLREDYDVVRVCVRTVSDAKEGVTCLHRDEIPASEPVRGDRPDHDGRQVAGGPRSARGPHDAEGDEHHHGHDYGRHPSPHVKHRPCEVPCDLAMDIVTLCIVAYLNSTPRFSRWNGPGP